MKLFSLLALAFTVLPAYATTVVLDTGHTPTKPGARSAYGRQEYGFNAQLAEQVARQLQQRGIKVVRVQGEYTLTQRTQNTKGIDLFLSIHHDSMPQAWIDAGKSGQYSGYSVFVSPKNTHYAASFHCARAVGKSLAQSGEHPSLYHALPIKGENRPLISKENGVHSYPDLIVLKTARAPAILVEAGVIANAREDQRLGQMATAQSLARAIAQGVDSCVGH